MEEKKIIFILCLFLVTVGLVSSYLYLNGSTFNFYKSEITIKDNQIIEKVYFKPSQDYHTLFRNFADIIYVNYPSGNSITIKNVKCSHGTPYVYARDGFFTFSNDYAQVNSPMSHTESNEYGCSFSEEYGFIKGHEYWIESTYILNPVNLFEINGKDYIKFVAYSPDNHVTLKKDQNLIIQGDAIYSEKYLPKDNVLIYIPYEDTTDKSIIKLNSFEYDNNGLKYFFSYLFSLLPALFLFLIWKFFGKENSEPQVPSSLSEYPTKRKGWQVASYFNPPFNQIDNSFISTMMLDFYKRKIIDIKTSESFFSKKCYIKILQKPSDLDIVEKKFLENLQYLGNDARFVEKGYIDISKAGKHLVNDPTLRLNYALLQKEIAKQGLEYMNSLGAILYILSFVILCVIAFYSKIYSMIAPAIAGLIIGVISLFTSSLLIRFNKSYYEEYVKWQSFRNHLNHAPSLKIHGYKGVVLWDEYLIYAAALGVSDKVIKQLANKGIISKEQASNFVRVHHASTSFASATGFSSSGSSHGGAGGGGVGGGGGGGR